MLVASATASQAAVIISSSVNNGSFEDVTGVTGSTISGTNATFPGSAREAVGGAGTITIPGWTLEVASGPFAGVNFSGSTQSHEGVNNVVTNGGAITATSGEYALTPGETLFTYSANFHWTQNGGGTYSLSYEFTDGAGAVIDTQVIGAGVTISGPAFIDTANATTAYNDELSGSFSYAGAGTSVRVVATIEGGQTVMDNFTLDSSVPEPSTVLLGALGALGLLRRRR